MSSYPRPLPTPPPISPESFNLTNLTSDINNNTLNNNNQSNFQNHHHQEGVSTASGSSGLNLVNNGLIQQGSASNINNEPIVCNGCKLGLEEASDAVVVSFGERLWHVDCRCAKCHNLVEHDTNLLLLSDGSPVCENCSYICSVCQSPISNEAIVTGDESYHADCFRCRSCTNKIEELIFAKTSQGIWCMACHNERVARSRKHAEAKRNRSNRKEKERQASVSGTSSGSRRNTLADLEAAGMMPPPPTAPPGPNSPNYYDGNTPRGSVSSNYTPPSTSTSLSTLSSEPSLNHISSPRRHRAGAPPPTSHQLPPPIPSSSSSSDNRNRNPSYDLPSTNSNPSLTTTSSSTPSSPQQPLRSPLIRNNSPLLGSSSSSGNVRTTSPHNYQSDNNRTPNSPSSISQFNFPSSPRMGNNMNGGSESGGSRPNTGDPTNNNLPALPPRSPRLNTNYDSLNSNSNSNHLPHSLSTTSSNTLTTSSSNSLAGSASPPPSSRSTNLSLAAPSEKSSNKNRRSGFYGSNGKLSAAAGGSSAGSGTDGEGEGGFSGGEDNTAVIGGRRSPIPSSNTGGSLFSSIGIENSDNITASSVSRSFTPPRQSSPSPLATNSHSHSNSNTPTIDQQSFLPELHTSVSFYDPDTLLFLDHVGSEPNSPKPSPPLPSSVNNPSSSASPSPSTSTSVPRRANSIKPMSPRNSNKVEQIEELVQAEEAALAAEQAEAEESKKNHGPDSDEDEFEGIVGGRRRRSLVASTRLRESIRKSRDAGEMLDNALIHSSNTVTSGIGIGSLSGTGSAGMSMDVDLVEMLLGELDGTKMEMRDLQGKYSAFRRASRSAFEGFSMAREEYDKEVAARKEAESKMDLLKIKLTEQALTLAAVDKEQKTAEALKRQSTELRSSVVGMERHLSQLRAEVELSTAQVEELTSIDPEDADTTADGTATPAVNHLDIARSLNARLESVKDEHRRQIESLIQQRDNLTREVNELKITRDNYAEETSTLHAKKLSLLDQNAEATRHLESLKEAASRFRAATPVSNSAETSTTSHHQYTPSSSSTLLSTHATGTSSTTSRSPLAPSRIAAPPSPATIDHHAIESVRRIKPEEQLPSVAKKFKWGKGKSTEVPRSHNNSISSNGNLFNHNTNGSPSSKTPPPPGSRSISGNNSNNANTNGGNGGGNSGNGEMRTHGFQQTSILRPVRCEYCGDKMWGLNEVRCTTCGCYSHAKCAGYLQGTCNTQASHGSHEEIITANPNGLVMFGTDLTTQTRVEDRQVPIVVSKCIAAVETYGMNYEGIYRKTGGTGQVRLITQYFERGQDFDLEDLDKFNDLAAVTSCMKNFFRTLPDPLFTHELHEEFVSCVEQPEGENRLNSLEITLYKLPEAHFFTARALMVHLHRIHLRSSENKMTPANLGVVFGPTVLRSITPSREFSDMGFKAKIVELMVEHQPRLFSKPYHSSASSS